MQNELIMGFLTAGQSAKDLRSKNVHNPENEEQAHRITDSGNKKKLKSKQKKLDVEDIEVILKDREKSVKEIRKLKKQIASLEASLRVKSV